MCRVRIGQGLRSDDYSLRYVSARSRPEGYWSATTKGQTCVTSDIKQIGGFNHEKQISGPKHREVMAWQLIESDDVTSQPSMPLPLSSRWQLVTARAITNNKNTETGLTIDDVLSSFLLLAQLFFLLSSQGVPPVLGLCKKGKVDGKDRITLIFEGHTGHSPVSTSKSLSSLAMTVTGSATNTE